MFPFAGATSKTDFDHDSHPENVEPAFDAGDLKALFDNVASLAREIRSAQARLADDRAGWSVLAVLQEQGARTVPEIARALGTSRQNIQTVANRLEERGAVRFERNPGHQRSDLIRVTPEGQDLLRQGSAAEKRLLHMAGRSVSSEDTAMALEVLRKLRVAVDTRPKTVERDAGENAGANLVKRIESVRKRDVSPETGTTELPYNLL